MSSLTAIVLIAGLIGSALMSQPASAFFEKTDRTEAYLILPNESAFWIPDVGDNKSAQVQMESEAYLNERKVATKRFVVPHQKMVGSAGYSMFAGYDYFVPTGRLIIVDRTPFSREWVDSEERGTSKQKEGFPCQSKEGLNITLGISIGTSVLEANSAKFLYRFGVKPPAGTIKGTRESIEHDGQIIFTSVYHGRSLKEVMDDVGRKRVQTLACAEISSRSFDEANAQANQIMQAIEAKSKAYFESVGVSLDFIGWGDTFEFDKSVQDAVNRRYIALQDKAIAEALAPHSQTLQALAAAYALQRFGDKTDGKLPTTVVGLPPELSHMLGTILKSPGISAPTK